jgi:hypothetical protein
MNRNSDMSFPAWLWVILAGFMVIAGAVTFKMAQAYSKGSAASAPTTPAAVVGDSEQSSPARK